MSFVWVSGWCCLSAENVPDSNFLPRFIGKSGDFSVHLLIEWLIAERLFYRHPSTAYGGPPPLSGEARNAPISLFASLRGRLEKRFVSKAPLKGELASRKARLRGANCIFFPFRFLTLAYFPFLSEIISFLCFFSSKLRIFKISLYKTVKKCYDIEVSERQVHSACIIYTRFPISAETIL